MGQPGAPPPGDSELTWTRRALQRLRRPRKTTVWSVPCVTDKLAAMAERSQRRLAAILAADVAGYSRLIGEDEEGTLRALRDRRSELVEPLLAEHGGRIANTAGDSYLIEFASAVDAARFALALQQGLAAKDDGVPETRRIRFRIGINVGDVVVQKGDLLGDGVNIAARIEAQAAPGGIALSDDAYRQVRGRAEADWQDGGAQALKNIAEPVRIWHWAGCAPDAKGLAPAAPASATLGPEGPSIAVMPFENRSHDPEQDYFADGITEDIITELSRLPALLVIARNSTFAYKGKGASLETICRELKVRFLLEGSVRKAGSRVRVTAQLVDGQSGGHLWAERYDRELADIFAVQDDVTAQIVEALALKLVTPERAPAQRQEPGSTEAYDCVLRAREQYRLFTKDGNAAARALYERAIALDPDYAEPYAGLAETSVQDWFMGREPTLDRAFALAQSAAERDADLPLVQEALSTVYLFQGRSPEAVATARRWIDLEPGNAEAYATLAGALHFAGENEAVVALIETAMRLNPHYPFYYPHYVGLANLGLRRFEPAVAAFKRAVSRSPQALWPHVFLAAAYGHLGKEEQARAALEEVRRLNPAFSLDATRRLLPYKNEGDRTLVSEGLGKAGLVG